MPIVDPHTGEISYWIPLFVAVLGASNYALPVPSSLRITSEPGGIPQLVVPDCLKSAVHVARNIDPSLNPTYQMLVAHFGTAIMPARPREPKDKSKMEVGGADRHPLDPGGVTP